MGEKYQFHSPHSRTEQEVQAQEVKRLLEEDHKDSHPTWCYNHTKVWKFYKQTFLIIEL